jgi:hypothetical protein
MELFKALCSYSPIKKSNRCTWPRMGVYMVKIKKFRLVQRVLTPVSIIEEKRKGVMQ